MIIMGNSPSVTHTIDLVTANEQNITINFRCKRHQITYITIYNKTTFETFSIFCYFNYEYLEPRHAIDALVNKNGRQIIRYHGNERIIFYDHMIACNDKLLLFDDAQLHCLIELLNKI